SLEVFASGAVKFAVLRPSPAEKSLGSGSKSQVALMAGLIPMPRGSRPLGATIKPVLGSSVGMGFKLYGTTLPVEGSVNSRMPALMAAVGTKRENTACVKK